MTRTDKLVAAHWGVARVRMTDGRPALVPIVEDMRPSERMADYLAGRDGAERLLAPKVREGYLRACREGRDPALTREGRGREAFVEVEWEEALELAARAIERTYADHGPSAVWGRSYGWKNTGEVNNPIGLLRRLLMLKGGFVQTFNSYSTAAIAAIQKVIAGSGDPDVPPAAEVLEHAERVILWGADPVVTNDIAWTTTLHDTAKVFEAMRTKEGLEVVAVNPVKPETLDVTGGRWIAPLPGTDAAFALGLVHTLLATGRADRYFLETRTTGFETLEACLNGRLDGVVRDAAWAAGICGLDEKTIRDFAEELAAHRTMIMLGWGPQRARYGESTVWAVWALAAALGQIGGRGTGIGTRYHYSSGGAGASAGRGLPEAASRRRRCRRAPESGKAHPLRRHRARIPRHSPRLLGGRQSLRAPSRHGTPRCGLQTARRRHRLRRLRNGDNEICRHIASRLASAGKKRHCGDRRLCRAWDREKLAGVRAQGKCAFRLRDLQASCREARS